ncbi:MAG: hypothetical protein E7523_04690 [Ruminococcaceae bacterium]|nr:hypothetical protein [Oscillospiraceae bacterium]
MLERLKRIGKWEKKMLFAVLDGAVSGLVLFFLSWIAVSSLWDENIWLNVCFIVLAAAVSSFGYWCITDDLTDKRKPFYCLLISLGCTFLFFMLLMDYINQNISLYILFGNVIHPSFDHLAFPDAAHALLIDFTICVYAAASVLLRGFMCIVLEVRNHKMQEIPLLQNRYRRSRFAVVFPFLLVSAVCFALGFLYLHQLEIKVNAMSHFERMQHNRSIRSQRNLVYIILSPVFLGLHPVWENLNKYTELFDTYVRFNSFRFRWPQPAKSIQVKYEDIYVIDAKFIGKKLRYIELGCHNFKHKVRLSASIVGHKELFARLYNEVVKVNPDVFISEELKELLASYQQKP